MTKIEESMQQLRLLLRYCAIAFIAAVLSVALPLSARAQEIEPSATRATPREANIACERIIKTTPQGEKKRKPLARQQGSSFDNQTLNVFCNDHWIGDRTISKNDIQNRNEITLPPLLPSADEGTPRALSAYSDNNDRVKLDCQPSTQNCNGTNNIGTEKDRKDGDELAELWRSPINTIIYVVAFVLSLTAAIIILSFFSKLLFFLLTYLRMKARSPSWNKEIQTALPFQERLLSSLESACSSEDRAPVAVALKGTWGSGKTTLIRILRSRLCEKKNTAAVYVNVWQLESDPLPEFALYREITREWKILKSRFAWLTVPALKLFATTIPRSWKMVMEFGAMKVEVDNQSESTAPPVVQWQSHLKSLVAASKIKVIVILDDLDRCSPLAAQRFLTLSRRFLSIPNVVVIIPYVEEQLRYKVFNPMQPMLPDMAGTFEAILWTAFKDSLIPKSNDEPEKKQATVAPNDSSPDDRKIGSDASHENVRQRLVNMFFSEAPGKRERIVALGEDKYLADRIVPIDGFSGEDLAHIVAIHWKARRWLTESFSAASETENINEREPEDWLKIAPFQDEISLKKILASLWDSSMVSLPSKPTIRQIFSALDDLIAKAPTFNELDRKQHFPSALTVLFLAIRYSHQRVHLG